jgi:hypothetical protein
MNHGFPYASLLNLANRSAEHPVRLLRADQSSAEVACDAHMTPDTPVRLNLTDGTVLGRITRTRSGVVSIAVDHVSPSVPNVLHLMNALSAPDRVRCSHNIPCSR